MSARILVVDDHEVVREGIRRLLAQMRPDWEICGEASNGRDAVEAEQKLKPDVTVLDVSMPGGMSGLEAARRITGTGSHSRILIFTMHEGERMADEIRQAGAAGYVQKSQAAQDLVQAIERLLEGGSFFPQPQTAPEAQP